jgi:ubiquinone/menaquinone biosynthesis C-methylase UbiE
VRELGRADRALDLGAGDGRLGAELDAGEVVLADVSEVALARARARVPGALRVHVEPDEPLPLPDSDFDLVLCADVLEHVRDVQLFLSEARRVLRPGGRLGVVTPAHGRLTGLGILVRGFERGFDPLSPHLRFFTARSLRRVLDELGFEVESVRRVRGDLLALARR